MRLLKELGIGLLPVLTLVGWTGLAQAGGMDDLTAGAKKEGTLEFYAPSSITPQGAEALGAAFDKKYGLDTTF